MSQTKILKKFHIQLRLYGQKIENERNTRSCCIIYIASHLRRDLEVEDVDDGLPVELHILFRNVSAAETASRKPSKSPQK